MKEHEHAEHKGFPKAVYHPVTGECTVCKSAADLPDEYTEDFYAVGDPDKLAAAEEKILENLESMADKLKKAYKKGYKEGFKEGFKDGYIDGTKVTPAPAPKPAAKAAPEPDEEDVKSSDTSTKKAASLSDLDMSRKEAKALLKAEKVEFAGNAKNSVLAALVTELLEDDESE